MEFGPEVTHSVFCVFLCKGATMQALCDRIFLLLMHERNPGVVISTQLCWQNLLKVSL